MIFKKAQASVSQNAHMFVSTLYIFLLYIFIVHCRGQGTDFHEVSFGLLFGHNWNSKILVSKSWLVKKNGGRNT